MEAPRDDEALVRLGASGICHTDIVTLIFEKAVVPAPSCWATKALV
jgi:Zn-dependent alcohol dehydrogenase